MASGKCRIVRETCKTIFFARQVARLIVTLRVTAPFPKKKNVTMSLSNYKF